MDDSLGSSLKYHIGKGRQHVQAFPRREGQGGARGYASPEGAALQRGGMGGGGGCSSLTEGREQRGQRGVLEGGEGRRRPTVFKCNHLASCVTAQIQSAGDTTAGKVREARG